MLLSSHNSLQYSRNSVAAMRRWLHLAVIAIGSCSAAISHDGGFIVASGDRGNATLVTRQSSSFNKAVLSISSMAAIGDSYSAGIGAGDKLGSADEFLNPDSGKFTFKSTLGSRVYS